MSRSLRELSQRFWRKTARLTHAAQDDGLAAFVCNLCNASNRVLPSQLTRETPSCASCGSTVRFRSIAHLLVRELLGEDRALPDLPESPHIVGIGLSDALSYAVAAGPALQLHEYILRYRAEARHHGSSELAGGSARLRDCKRRIRACRAAGIPCIRGRAAAPQAGRRIHPDRAVLARPGHRRAFSRSARLQDRRAAEGTRRLQNRTREGSEQAFDGLVFHGGDGATLEMRLFSRAALLRELRDAGFSRVRLANEACPRFGIVWREPVVACRWLLGRDGHSMPP